MAAVDARVLEQRGHPEVRRVRVRDRQVLREDRACATTPGRGRSPRRASRAPTSVTASARGSQSAYGARATTATRAANGKTKNSELDRSLLEVERPEQRDATPSAMNGGGRPARATARSRAARLPARADEERERRRRRARRRAAAAGTRAGCRGRRAAGTARLTSRQTGTIARPADERPRQRSRGDGARPRAPRRRVRTLKRSRSCRGSSATASITSAAASSADAADDRRAPRRREDDERGAGRSEQRRGLREGSVRHRRGDAQA